MLVDIARHAAKAYAATGELREDEALSLIKSYFDNEWESPTDEPEQLNTEL